MIASDHPVISKSLSKLLQNIRTLRELKGWTQDTMATLLGLSEKAYANIERGQTKSIRWSRLEEIATLLEVEVTDLINLERGMIFNFFTHNSSHTAYNQASVNSSSTPSQHLEHELEKARLVIEQKDKEIAYLKEIIELRKGATMENGKG